MKPGPFTHCVFDAYGTLFDVHSAVGRYREVLGEKADPVSILWRTKQLEYTWLRSLMRQHVDFWQITSDALEYAFSAHEIINPELQNRLLQAYHQLDCYPEVPETLKWLKDQGFGTAILSNGSPKMLASGVNNLGLEKLIGSVLSVEEVGVFKPDPRVYQLAVEQLKTEAAISSSSLPMPGMSADRPTSASKPSGSTVSARNRNASPVSICLKSNDWTRFWSGLISSLPFFPAPSGLHLP